MIFDPFASLLFVKNGTSPIALAKKTFALDLKHGPMHNNFLGEPPKIDFAKPTTEPRAQGAIGQYQFGCLFYLSIALEREEKASWANGSQLLCR